MISLNLDRTELLDNGLRFSPDYGVLLAPPKRLKIDPSNPRREISEEDIQGQRADIDGWREEGHGLLKTGFMEPLKCRWEPGAVLADGSIRKNAKLLVCDGELKFRATRDDYEWLPVTLDDLNAGQARSAALLTSIHNKAHSPIEQAHAFAAEIQESGENLRSLAKKYKVDKSYIENRLNLLKAPPDVQHFAANHPKLMSHALAMCEVRGKERRTELMQYATHGASVRELQAIIAEEKEEYKQEAETRRAPDAETQSRQSKAVPSGSAPMSRKRRITTVSKREATQEAASAVNAAGANLDTVSQWVEQGGTLPRAALMELRRRIDALLNLDK